MAPPDVAGDMTDIEPLFYRGRGFTAFDAVFTIIRRGFSAPKKKEKNVFGLKKKKKKINMHLCYNGDIGFYRENAIAIQKESGDSNGGNV